MTQKGQTIQSVLRALAILETVADNPMPLNATAVARAQDLPLPTAYHLLNTLVAAGYLQKDGRSYSLAGKVADLSRAFESNLRPDFAVQAAMHSLASRTGETVYVSRWHQGDVTIVDVAEGTQAVRVAGVHMGLRGSANARASGKVLLAFGPPERVNAYLSGKLERLTPQTLVDPAELRRELEAVRERGYAVDREEFIAGVSCLAAPCGSDIALTVTIPTDRFEQVEQSALAALTATTASLIAAGGTAAKV